MDNFFALEFYIARKLGPHFFTLLYNASTEPYPEPRQASKIELSTKLVNGFKPLTFFAKRPVLDVCQGSEYVTVEEVEKKTVFFIKFIDQIGRVFQWAKPRSKSEKRHTKRSFETQVTDCFRTSVNGCFWIRLSWEDFYQ